MCRLFVRLPPMEVAKADMSEDPKLERPANADRGVQKEVEEKITQKPSRKLFGTFGGVFTPTLLTLHCALPMNRKPGTAC